MDKSDTIYVAGHKGMVGSAIVRELREEGFDNLVLRSHSDLDLLDQEATFEFFEEEAPEYVALAAAKVGGIMANDTYRAQFIYENIQIQNNVIHAAYENDVKKLIFLGSSCIYPKYAPQPIKEEHLLSGKLEDTNEPYAIAKIAGIKTCENYYRQYGSNFYSVMPTNLYGPNDNFDLETSHVLPALLRKFYEAEAEDRDKVTLWGTGEPEREFMHVDDMADAFVYLLEEVEAEDVYDKGITHINIGTGKDLSINELAELIAHVVGYEGQITHDLSKPDGTPKKLLDVSRLHELGWEARIPLREGIKVTLDWYKKNYDKSE
ncbi:MAG: GDP-L-fucose synthase family protein [Candidatus Bipolaricaulota bacterium]